MNKEVLTMEQRLNEAPCGIFTLNCAAEIVQVNQTLSSWLKVEKTQIVGSHFEKWLSVANRLIFHSYIYPNLTLEGKVEEMIIHLKAEDGESQAYLFSARKFFHEDGEFIDCVLLPMRKRMNYEIELRTTKRQIEDAYEEKDVALSKLQQLHQEIEAKQAELLRVNRHLLEMSNTDKLTGIPNRRLFQEKLEEFVERYETKGKGFSLCLLDIDFFKKVNDTYGHPVGDIVLQKLAALIVGKARTQDIVARYGGEEFVVILPDCGIEESLQMAEMLNRAVEQAEWPETGGLTISLGVATYSEGDTIDSIVEEADQALYASKQNGRNRATHYMSIN